MTESGPPSVLGPSSRLPRFTRGERWVHRSLGLLMLGCLVTAAMLSTPTLSQIVGRRFIVSRIHIACGLLLPLPVVLGLLLSAGFRADVRRLNRFSPSDWRWIWSKEDRKGRLGIGKFNAGQKLNAAFVLGGIILMFATGFIMWRNEYWPVAWRTGATFVHDWLALGLLIVIIGHLVMASRDGEARTGMREGDVDRRWAEQEHPKWAAQVEGELQARLESAVSDAATARTPPEA
jgi:formate dehydrogenase subunit gamma